MFEARLDYMANFRSIWPLKGFSICCINSIYIQNKCTRAETGGPEKGRIYPLGVVQIRKLNSLPAPCLSRLHSSGAIWFHRLRCQLQQRGPTCLLQGWQEERRLVCWVWEHLDTVIPGQGQRAKAGRLYMLFMTQPPPRTVNRGASSWHQSPVSREGLR